MLGNEQGLGSPAPASPTRSGMRRSKINMGDPRPERCVNSKGRDVDCWCPLASRMCARQSKNRDSYFAAIRQGRLDVITFLLSPQNCELERVTNFRDWLHVRDPGGQCGLHVAVRFKKERILACLLEHVKQELDFGELLDLADNDGNRPMLEAARLGSVRMVTTLRVAGANWTSTNHELLNARDLALAGGHNEVVAYYDQGQNMGQDEAAVQNVHAYGEHDESEEEEREDVGEEVRQLEGVEQEEVTEQAKDMEVSSEMDDQELQDRCDILKMHPIFESLHQEHVQLVARSSLLRKYRRNMIILGSEATVQESASMFFVLSGEVRVQKQSNNRHDDLLEEGDAYGERALLTGDESADIVHANKDSLLMFVSKAVMSTILFIENTVYAETVGASWAGKVFQDAQSGKAEISSDMEEGEFHYGKEIERMITIHYEIPIIEEVKEEIDRKARKIQEVPLLDDILDGVPIRMMHNHDFGSDKKVSDRIRGSAAKNDEEYLFQYVDACQELGTQPMHAVIFQIRRSEKVMNLRGLQMNSKQALALSAALTYVRAIEGVDLSNNPIFDNGCLNSDSLRCCGIVNSIALNTHIKTLILSRTRISRVTAAQLGDVLAHHASILKLDLSCNNLADEGIEALAKGLSKSSSIRDLNVSNTRCTFRGATALGHMFRSNQTLEIVNLSWNNFLCKGSTALLKGITMHPKLVEVHMEWNLLGHSGGTALGQLLQATTTIKRVDVSHCGIPASAAGSICAGLANNSVLENMQMQFNPLKDGVPLIKDTMFANKNWKDRLPSIRLDNCEFDVCNYATAVVNSTIPTGHYKFDLSKPDDRKELGKLVTLAISEDGENWRNETLDGVRFNYPKAHAWVVPPKGILELDFVDMGKRDKDGIMPEVHFKQLTTMLNGAASSEARIDLIKQVCTGYRILGEDAMALMYSLNRTPEREEALMALFSRLCGRDAIMPKILLSCFNRREVEHVQYRLGTYYTFDSYRPEGKYRFDLGKQMEIDAMCHLIGIKQKIPSSEFKFVRVYDLTSRVNSQSVENVENFLVEENWPKSGILELDFHIPDTVEGLAEKKMFVEAELAQLERCRSVSKGDQVSMSLAGLGFEYEAGNPDEHDSDDPDSNKKEFNFEEAMNRTRTEYKLVCVLHPDKAGIVRCSDMAEKPFNAHWDGGKTTIVVMLEEKDQTRRVQVMTPRGFHEHSSMLIHWGSPFKSTIDIGVEEKNEEVIKRESSVLHQARLKRFEEKKSSPLKQKTVPKKGGQGLRPVTPETFANVKSLDFGLALRRSQGQRMWKAWTGFTRSDPADFKVHQINLKAMSQNKNIGGVVSKRLKGSLGPASCVNYEIDLSMLVTMHTVPRYFSFQLSQNSSEMNLYVSIRSLPWEKDYVWKGEVTDSGDRLVVVRPTDRNYQAGKYYVSIISGPQPADYEFVAEISPYQASLKYVDTVKLPRFASTKADKGMRSGLAPPQKVADLTNQNSKAGKMLSSLMNFTEERKSKSCFGAAVPDKAVMTIRGQGQGNTGYSDINLSHSGSTGTLRAASSYSSRSRGSTSSLAASPS